MDGSPNYTAPATHLWQRVAAGRICQVCMLTQALDEFDDRVPCAGARRAVDSAAMANMAPPPASP